MRPFVKLTSSRICDITSHPARRTAGVMNLVQMSRSLRVYLSILPGGSPLGCECAGDRAGDARMSEVTSAARSIAASAMATPPQSGRAPPFFVLCVCGFLTPVRLPPFYYRRAGSSSVHASQPALPGELRSLEWGCQPPAVERPDQIAPRSWLILLLRIMAVSGRCSRSRLAGSCSLKPKTCFCVPMAADPELVIAVVNAASSD